MYGYSSPGHQDGIAISEAVQQQKIIVEQVSTSKDFEEQESKTARTRVPSLELTKERRPPQTTYTVNGW